MAKIKKLLKKGKKFMDESNYIQAEILFRQVLQREERNCMGLVYLGKVLGDTEEGFLCLRRAVFFYPRKPLAWCALANYFELKEDRPFIDSRLRIYEEILTLKITRDKSQEIVSKVLELGYSLKELKPATILLNYLCYYNPTRFMFNFTQIKLLELLKVAYDEDQLASITERITQTALMGTPNEFICILLGKIVLMNSNFVQAFEQLTNLHFFEPNVKFRLWVCKYLCSIYSQNESFRGLDIERYKQDIIRGITDDTYPKLLDSMIFYDKKNYIDSYLTCHRLVDYESPEKTVCIFFLKCTFKNRNWVISEVVAKKLLVNTTEVSLRIELTKYLFMAQAYQKKWAQAMSSARGVPMNELAVKEQVLLATCYIEFGQNADHILNLLQPTVYYIQLKALVLMVEGKYLESIAMLIRDIDSPEKFFYLGRAYWHLNHFEDAYANFTKAILQDRQYAEAFHYLGLCNENNRMNLEAAKINYKRAHELDRTNPTFLKSLSDIYLRLNLTDENFHLLESVNQLVIKLPWLHIRLGIYFKEKSIFSAAIIHLQCANKYDETDAEALEQLAETYEMAGNSDLAIKYYNKALIYSEDKQELFLTKIAKLKLLSGRYKEAIIIFEKVLRLDPTFSLALKGLAQCHLKLAKLSANGNQYENARQAGQTSIAYIIMAINMNTSSLDYWTTLARVILFMSTLPHNHCYMDINFGINQELGNLGMVYLKPSIYKLGFYCFWRGQCLLPPHVETSINIEIAREIYQDEANAERVRCSNLIIEYVPGRGIVASRSEGAMGEE